MVERRIKEARFPAVKSLVQLGEHPRPLPLAVTEDAGHRDLGVVIHDRLRHAAEECKCSNVAVAKSQKASVKMMKFSVPPGYVRKKAPAKPKLDPFIPMIDSILRDDKLRLHPPPSANPTQRVSAAGFLLRLRYRYIRPIHRGIIAPAFSV